MLHALDRRTAVAFLVAATFFMENLDATADERRNGNRGVGALALSVAEALRGTHAGTAGAADFHLAFWFITALAALGVADSVLLPRSAGAHILARR